MDAKTTSKLTKPEIATQNPSTQKQKKTAIMMWNGSISSQDQNFYKFIENNDKAIVKIIGAANDDAVQSSENGSCVIGHTDSGGMGTNYIVECHRQAGEWRVNGFFTQREWIFHRGHMEIILDRVPDGVVLLQEPIVRPYKP